MQISTNTPVASSPAQRFIAMYGDALQFDDAGDPNAAEARSVQLTAVDPTTVKLTYTSSEDDGDTGASMAGLLFNPVVQGAKLVIERADGNAGENYGFSLDDEIGSWLWDTKGVKEAKITNGEPDWTLGVQPDNLTAQQLDDLLVDRIGGPDGEKIAVVDHPLD